MTMQGLLLLLLLYVADCSDGTETFERDSAITNFLAERDAWQPMCLYTFDDHAINNGVSVTNHVPNDACPFDALQPDNELVTSLNTASSFWQLGVRLTEDPNHDPKRVQLSSISSVSSREFFTMAAVRNKTASDAGVTFEMVIRRRAKTSDSMTLFSVANEYDKCVDPGFRLDVNEHQVLAFVYFLPVLESDGEAGVEACYEQRLFSVDTSAACQLPPVLEPVERTPAVQLTVTLDPSSERGLWKTAFYMSYTDVETMQRVDCAVHDEQHPPSANQLLNKLIDGRYHLYVGNSPRNVTSPRQRKRLAPIRELHPLGTTASNLNATERLRVMLMHKLKSISGPRVPKTMRIFGDNSLSLHILGVTFPPLDEDTPLAYLRSKFVEFRKQYGDQIVDYFVNLIQHKAKDPIVTQQSSAQSSDTSGQFSRATLFQGAGSATFDLFHFAIYRRVVSEEQVQSVSRRELLPSRQLPSVHQTVKIPEDSVVLLNLTMLHGVFNDLRLELRELPEFGQLLLFPNKTVVTLSNKNLFRELPLEYQRRIFFQPTRDQNNDNLPLPNPVAFSRRLEPYATVTFGIADSFAGRVVDNSTEAKIDLFVDAVNDAPRPRTLELEICVDVDVPVALELNGDDIDGPPLTAGSKAGASDSSDLPSSFTFTNETTSLVSSQVLQIVRMVQFGRLYDCNASCSMVVSDQESLLPFRIDWKSTNATYSTNLTYIYHGWGQDNRVPNESNVTPLVVDELWYRLSDGDPTISSDAAVIKFILRDQLKTPVKNNVVAAIRLEEDALQLLNLATLDPLAAFFNAETWFKVTVLPQHGALFEYNDLMNGGVEATNCSLGARIRTPNTIVKDLWGRVVYVPQLDYFNLEKHPSFTRVSAVDYFEYQAFNTTPVTNDSLVVYEKSLTARFINGFKARRVEFEVVNVPDALLVLPPFNFTANLTNYGSVPTPVVFETPDSTNPDDMYQVNLETEDDSSEFELGFTITDDDIMTGCPFERPCTLIRSITGTHLDVNSSRTQDNQLQFHITTQLYDPSHIELTGTKTALNAALSSLTFRDLSGISLGIPHTARFRLWLKRVDNENDAETQQAEATFTINFPTKDLNGSDASENLISTLSSQLERYISTSLILIAVWLVLSNASCLSIGFCCCCSKAQKKRRRELERQQQLFQAQVAQNDYEYSALLMSLADLLLEPNLLVSRCVLESCVTPTRSSKSMRTLTQALILRSLVPLLESERQGTRFVFQLLAIEYVEARVALGATSSLFQCQGFLKRDSLASKTLAYFCRVVGAQWVSTLMLGDDESVLYLEDDLELERFLDRLDKQLATLPVEIVVLCRACVKLFQSDKSDESREVELDAVHLVLFNHFLGPALLFPQGNLRGCSPLSTDQQKTFREIAYRLVTFVDQRHSSDYITAADVRSRGCNSDSLLDFAVETQSAVACRVKYDAVLSTIAQSSRLRSVYDPNELSADVDCELMGLCLMNIHSLLDSYFLGFKRRMFLATNNEQTEDTIARLSCLLKALSWPLVTIHELVEFARPELENDPLLWNGFSFQEWRDRAQTQQQQAGSCRPFGDRRTQSSRWEEQLNDDEVILEEDGRSPHDVDWLTT